ncbi:sigma-70 family RNA polymerase sigma factor [Methylomonas methanica]|uniref:RNA polymerase, sigma 32 subunit, RpoH n=1 Tax=Methylomonas methanica (strain DSM 25384 / MC09) TaxID=857087 RepID=G0A1P4_METMM|nr:sigma-70 family RNA polymerase sigma factor [Methylomonas methanica]AEG00105.1 RNA polymerase, sigma 32 subunit, RpoH [Methylomonas methanica MC09]
MTAISEVITQTASPASESEPVILAGRVEQARRKLLELLFENNRVAGFIVRQLLLDLKKGVDNSDIVLVKNNDAYKNSLHRFVAEFAKQDVFFDSLLNDVRPVNRYNVVQDYSFVQVLSDMPIERIEVSAVAHGILRELHFLSIYLIEVSEIVENELGLLGELEPGYRARLQRVRYELKSLRQEMIASNTGLVAFVAHKYKTVSLSFDDLMQEGMVGLIKAVDRFDPERGNCFSTYAIYWIRQAISRLIVKQDKVVPLPVALAEKSSPIFEVMRTTFLQHERWPTLAELKANCDLSEQDIKTISSYYQATYMQDIHGNEDDDGMSTMEKMQQQQFNLPLDDLIDTDLVSYMDRAVATLPEKQAVILAMRFGLKNHTEMTLQAVADQLQVTRERVRQIQNEALQKLKQQFGFDLMLFLEPKDT